MAKKPFPFKVCELCCNTSGGGGSADSGRVYKYEMSCTWTMLRFGLIESDIDYPFEVGMVFNIEEDDVIPPEYTESGDAIKVLSGDNIAIAAIIDNKPKFDKLSASVDLSNYVTKDDIGDIETALDNIIAIQNSLIGGDA